MKPNKENAIKLIVAILKCAEHPGTPKDFQMMLLSHVAALEWAFELPPTLGPLLNTNAIIEAFRKDGKL